MEIYRTLSDPELLITREVHREVAIGREPAPPDGAIEVGADDPRLSRTALRLRPNARGWQQLSANTNGVSWQLPGGPRGPAMTSETWVDLRRTTAAAWLHTETRCAYLVCLAATTPGSPYDETREVGQLSVGRTELENASARALTKSETEALLLTFAEFSAWPPMREPRTRKFASVARDLGISETALKKRLQNARRKAGEPTDLPLTDPTYFYRLVARGLLPDAKLVSTR